MLSEAAVRDHHGSVQYRRDSTVARFHEVDDFYAFLKWLKDRNYTVLSVKSTLTIAFAAPAVRIK